MRVNNIVPQISYPVKNENINLLNTRPWRKPGPIKHYRKQLNPQLTSRKNNATIDRLNQPGGSLYTNTVNCDTYNNLNLIKEL